MAKKQSQPKLRRHGVHKYERVMWGKDNDYPIFRCRLPGCAHYVPEIFILGRQAICWGCGEVFVIDHEAKRRKRPHCPDCTKDKPWLRKHKETEEVKVKDILANLDELLK